MSTIVCPCCYTYIPRNTTEEIFWSQVDRSGDCWLWVGITDPSGYGYFAMKGKDGSILQRRAHRTAWCLSNGDIPEGMCICHKCDNRICVRPDHLWLGTPADNTRDMVSKGRGVHGMRHKSAKLTDDKVREIVEKLDTGEYTRLQLADEYSITPESVSRIVRGSTWKHLKVAEPTVVKHRSEKDVLSIREEYAAGDITQRELARKYGLHVSTISHIITRKSWDKV